MLKPRVVKEYETLTCNKDYESNTNYQYLDEKYFRELERFIKNYTSSDKCSDVLEFMRLGYRRNVGDTISVNSYVGTIELPSGYQIEILPKVSFDDGDDDNKKTKRVFLDMLCCLKEFEGKAFRNATLNADRMNLYEIFIKMFLQETRALVKHGIKSAYVRREDNSFSFKGKLQVSQHIKFNLAHKERFYVSFDEYLVNRAENRLIKATLLKLQSITRSMENYRECNQLLAYFELVDASTNYEKDFAQVSLGRDTKEYELLVQWAKVFLLNKSITTFSGKNIGKAILFPMETVFQDFVAKWIKEILEDQFQGEISISTQDKGRYLFDEPRKFNMRPDIVVKGKTDGKKWAIVMDTKWKKLNTDSKKNYGISQADMYQMYAYSKKYRSSEIWLLYPFYKEVKELKDLSFKAVEDEGEQVTVNIFFIDLANYHKSMKELCDRIIKNRA